MHAEGDHVLDTVSHEVMVIADVDYEEDYPYLCISEDDGARHFRRAEQLVSLQDLES